MPTGATGRCLARRRTRPTVRTEQLQRSATSSAVQPIRICSTIGRSTGSVELKSCSTISERTAASSGVGPRSGIRAPRSPASGPDRSRATSRRAARACSRRRLHLRSVIIARMVQSSSQSATSNASPRHRRKKLLHAERTASSTSIRSRIQPSNCCAANPTRRRA